MSWLGGSDSSSVTNQTSENLTDQRVFADYGDVSGSKSTQHIDLKDSESIELNLLDGGVINESLDTVNDVVKAMQDSNASMVDQMTQAQLASLGLAKNVIDASKEMQKTESENVGLSLIKWGSLAAIVISLSMYLLKKGKK